MKFSNPPTWIGVFCLAVFSTANALFAQVPVRYVLHEVPLVAAVANTATSHNRLNNFGMAVGHHYPGGIKTGSIYDHYGQIGIPGTTHSLTEWVSVPSGWSSSCVGINDVGQVVGLFESTNGSVTQRVGYLLDLDIFSPTPAPSWRLLPSPAGSISSYGRRINNNGVVLIESQDVYGQYLFDSSDPGAALIQLVDPQSGSPISSVRFQDINDSSQLAGGTSKVRLTPQVQLLDIPLCDAMGINNDGDLALREIENSYDRRGQIIGITNHAARYSDATGLQRLSNVDSWAWDINGSGDICGYNNGEQNPAIYHDDFGWLYLDDLITGASDDVAMWLGSQSRAVHYIANRDATGFGSLYANAVQKTTTGKGKNATTTYEVRHFFLEPQTP